MNGPGPIPPQRRSTAVRAAVVLLRVVLTLVPLATLGILGWVPLVWLAVTRRRTQDWVMLCLTAFLCTGSLFLGGYTNGYDNWQTNVGVGSLLMLAVFCSVYFLFNDLRRRDRRHALPPVHQPYLPHPAGYSPIGPAVPVGSTPLPPPPTAPSGRIDQVRAELDELSAYLREHEREREGR